jgi:phosphoglycerate dehydrogenase-like enzyme
MACIAIIYCVEDVVVISERLGVITDEEQRIESHGAQVRMAPLWTLGEIQAYAANASIVMLGSVEPFDAAALQALDGCRGIVRRGIGVDNVDIDAATRLGIPVANVPDASVEEVSDHALALLIGLERRLGLLDRAVRSGRWRHNPAEIQAVSSGIRRMSELTLGIIGFGRIGRALARKSVALYRAVLVADPYADQESVAAMGAVLTTVDDVLARSDHLSLHAPLNASTFHLIDAAALRRIPPGAILVNTARGGLVDEEALIAALHADRLAAAGLDVTQHEPLSPDDPLLSESRILFTGHSAHEGKTSRNDLRRGSVEAVIALLRGEMPASLVNPEVLQMSGSRLAPRWPR